MDCKTEEFLEYVRKSAENKEPRPLREHLAEELLRQIVRKEREITDLVTNHKNGDVYARFSFTEEK